MAPANQNTASSLGDKLEGPAITSPAGITPNLDNPPNKNSLVHAVSIACLVVTSIFVLLRVYSRAIRLKVIHVADMFALAAFGIYLGFVYLFFKLSNSYGWFIHMWDLRLKDFPGVNRGLILYLCSVLLIKSAILLEWVFIFAPNKARNSFFWSSYIVLTTHGLFYVGMIILQLTACSPFERNWNVLTPGKCLDTTGIAVAISAINLAFDLVIFILPQKVIWALQMSMKRRLGISIIFAVGVLGCVAAGFRLSASLQFYKARDTSYTFARVALWCLAEETCAFIVFCAPSIPKAFGHLELQELASALRSWAGTSVRKLRSSGSSSRGSSRLASRKQSKSSLSQNGSHYQKMREPVPMSVPVPSVEIGSKTDGRNPSTTKSSQGGGTDVESAIVRTTQFTAVEERGSTVRKFIRLAYEAIPVRKKGVAMDCNASLGRTGCLIGAYLIYRHGFTAYEVIYFMRLMRSGVRL
ncbi:hypothetical protein DL769_002121 [Monosporascus sp. CRB-8-3]|nr:hypothetical protein DL769_002121 [Monosporascus sp. CRB-8-3]